jgi:fructose-1,6-bisphosphatase/inositol monophosphatase family enzyme
MVFRTWGDAYGYALVATGRAEAMIDPLANPWDVAPMAVIIPEAGGRYTTFDGTDDPDAWKTGSGVGTNGAVHDELLGLWASLS